jgi:hypothetical protein
MHSVSGGLPTSACRWLSPADSAERYPDRWGGSLGYADAFAVPPGDVEAPHVPRVSIRPSVRYGQGDHRDYLEGTTRARFVALLTERFTLAVPRLCHNA